MEEFIPIIIFIVVVNLLKSKAKKQAQHRAEQKAFRELPPLGPQAVQQQPSAAPAASMLPPRPEHKPVTSLEELAAKAVYSMEGRTDHSAHISCEGHDPCHEDQLRPARRPAAAAETAFTSTEETGGIELKFTGDELVRAFVMQEILTRPCERRGQAL